MRIELSATEHTVLLDILRERLGEMREQVYHADTSSFKDDLKHREAVIRGLIDKCEERAAV